MVPSVGKALTVAVIGASTVAVMVLPSLLVVLLGFDILPNRAAALSGCGW
jgi:hypothetical protein